MNRTSNHLSSALDAHNPSRSERILPFLLTMSLLAAPLMCLAQVPLLVTTFTNPTPAVPYFGYSAGMVGNDKVLISSFPGDMAEGMAYVFRTDGTLLTVYTNPTPPGGAGNDAFGFAVAPFGADRVLITAYRDGAGASAAGAAYLFDLNGTVQTTYTNPVPMPLANFGYSIAAVGSDRVLIGVRRDSSSVTNSGLAYLEPVPKSARIG